jgi:serine/threonine protein phosphatase 1
MTNVIIRALHRVTAALRRARAGNLGAESEPAYPRLVEDAAIYVIGDLHGRCDCLRAAHRWIDADRARLPRNATREIYLGDFIDRGPESCGVIDALIARAAGVDCRFLRGNHERVIIDFLAGRIDLGSWRSIGGYETILSYGQDPRLLSHLGEAAATVFARRLPVAHRAFLDALRDTYAVERYFFVHAGVRPDVALADQKEEDLLWIRDPFLASQADFGAIVVHGHSPVAEPEMRANRINLDTGAYATGRLAVARIDPDGVAVVQVDARTGR